MSTYEKGPGSQCARYADELAELALGIATGRRRAETLAHVERCQSCHAEMEELSRSADSMLDVIPGVEPPLGFEVRLAERLGAGRAVRRVAGRQLTGGKWRSRRLSILLACLLAIVALGAGVGTGWLVRGTGPRSSVPSAFGTEAGGRVATRSLVAGGRGIGYVTVYSAGTSAGADWLFMSLGVGSWSGEATCEVHLADGAKLQLGTFWLDDGYGAWGVRLPSGTGRIASASVLDAKGVLASADFASGTAASPTAGTTAGGYVATAGN